MKASQDNINSRTRKFIANRSYNHGIVPDLSEILNRKTYLVSKKSRLSEGLLSLEKRVRGSNMEGREERIDGRVCWKGFSIYICLV